MKKSNVLPDSFYDKEIERLSGLPRFPLVDAARKEIRRALRRVSETDGEFIRRLITQAVDDDTRCPTPAELIQRAGEIRHRAQASIGKTNCEQCHGTGWIQGVKRFTPAGMEPYDAEVSKPCACRGVAA